ncbi:hypothetical protein [Hoeflea prorocentri]|uniref:Transmembrane anchored protein n=1 Tax=Hoeflea prorocentri TaxID=1922333 RepID=A0A9X3UGG1_9HYPH|nr:hypothetical protein [Hoeflea prorocentri]MCY6380395.1 hypothetical protein [Hoeflea prorocentri]MDA5398195.1 hypothetical protein [Hoeflea prorocentri]
MNQTIPSTSPGEYEPLISPELIRKVLICIAVLGVLTILLSIGGRWMGQRMATAGFSTETAPVALRIGDQHLELPANTIRFESQRVDGDYERIEAYVSWPALEGYSRAQSAIFNGSGNAHQLVFLTMSERAMPLDMSERLTSVYSRLTTDQAIPGQHGLTEYEFDANTRYAGEYLYIGDRPGQSKFVVRCLRSEGLPNGARACMRDVNIAPDLTLTYRFSHRLLPEWQTLDRSITSFVKGALAAGNKRPAA